MIKLDISKPKIFLLLGLLAANTIIGVIFNNRIEIADLSTLISLLQNTSAMVFAISGIWIAYLYPKAIASLVSDQIDKSLEQRSDEEIGRIKLIVGIVIMSGLVMAGLIIASGIAPFLGSTNFYNDNATIFNSVGIFFIISLSEIQLFCIYGVLASCVSFIINLQNHKQSNKLNKKFGVTHPLHPKQDRKKN